MKSEKNETCVGYIDYYLRPDKVENVYGENKGTNNVGATYPRKMVSQLIKWVWYPKMSKSKI